MLFVQLVKLQALLKGLGSEALAGPCTALSLFEASRQGLLVVGFIGKALAKRSVDLDAGLDPILWSFASQPEEADIDLIAAHAPTYLCDIDQVNQRVAACGDRGMIRGTVASFAIYGQPGCRQDAAVLYGIAALILET